MAMAGEVHTVTDDGLVKRQRVAKNTKKKVSSGIADRIYLKEATVTVELGHLNEIRVSDLIKAITERIGEGKILAVRPKQNKEYEVTLEQEEDTEFLLEGLVINGCNCEVNRLQNRDYVVSFMHLPVYIADDEIVKKLKGWGVFPVSKIKRRVYPGTNIEDGTRFVKTRFPREVASLPYSTKMETAEGPQYFRVMHSHQVKTCRLCMSPDHVVKDCPDFKCFKCEERGHFARDCNAVTCPDCNLPLNRCECWMGNEGEEDDQQVDGQVHESDSERREEDITTTPDGETTVDKGVKQGQKGDNQDGNLQQGGGIWTQLTLTESLQDALDRVEKEDRENGTSVDIQKDGDPGTQMELTDSLQIDLTAMESDNPVCKERETEVEDGEGKEEEEKQAKPTKRRRSVKAIPNVDVARKKVPKQDIVRSENRFDSLKDLEEMD
ncbi:hypothetical protein C0J50_10389 [Silurus asotus]|uniref:CCHC-type domain-containing protein n=1 Tax=Silurus asotus TaxID=30991 RepID=A0AAD5B8B0_SILAS|nr:hypothetical protein C0J50_10389 [Silurus asotus]